MIGMGDGNRGTGGHRISAKYSVTVFPIVRSSRARRSVVLNILSDIIVRDQGLPHMQELSISKYISICRGGIRGLKLPSTA